MSDSASVTCRSATLYAVRAALITFGALYILSAVASMVILYALGPIQVLFSALPVTAFFICAAVAAWPGTGAWRATVWIIVCLNVAEVAILTNVALEDSHYLPVPVTVVIGLFGCGLALLTAGVVWACRADRADVAEGRTTKVGKAVLAGIVGALLIFAFRQTASGLAMFGAREHTRCILCRSNLDEIGAAITEYMMMHNGAFPADVRQCIANRSRRPNSEPVEMTCPGAAKANFVFIPENGGGGSNVPIGYEPLSNHKKGVHVLFADGHVEFVAKTEYDQVIARRKSTAARPR